MTEIEICRRSGAYTCRTRYHAQVKDNPGVWAAGESVDEAVGNLIRCHSEHFGVVLSYPEGVRR